MTEDTQRLHDTQPLSAVLRRKETVNVRLASPADGQRVPLVRLHRPVFTGFALTAGVLLALGVVAFVVMVTVVMLRAGGVGG